MTHRSSPVTDEIVCPKCGSVSGDDWSQCHERCPMPGSPHYVAALVAPAQPSPATDTALKPCPFCGCDAEEERYQIAHDDCTLFGVSCKSCTARIRGFDQCQADANEAWNTRAAPAQQPASLVTDEALALADKLSKLPMYYHKALNHNGGAYVEISDSMRVDLYSVLRAHAQCVPSLPPVEEIARVMWESDHEGSWDDIHANPTMTRRIYMGNAEAALAVFRQWSPVTSTDRCEHSSVHDGPRVDMRWGTAPTQVCECGAWRTMLHVPGQWQTTPLTRPESKGIE